VNFYRTTIFLCLSLFIVGTAQHLFAQPNLTLSGQLPQIGEVTPFRLGQVEGFNPGPAGANQNWDFSDLNFATSGVEFRVIDPAEGLCGASFPEADFAWFFPAFEGYTYDRVAGDTILQIGGATGTVADPLSKTVFSIPEAVLQFPFTYQTTYNYNSAFTTTIFGLEVGDAREGTVTYDGYGTLTLPGGATFTNVLRMRQVSTQDLLPGVEEVQYSWLLPGRFFPLLVYNLPADTEETPFVYYAQVTPNALLSARATDLGFRLAGNPVLDYLRISTPQPPPVETRLEVVRVDGRRLFTGAYRSELDISAAPAGTYYLVISNRAGRQIISFSKA